MPIEPIPNAPVIVNLERHQEIPEDHRPTFTFRALRRRDTKRLGTLLRKLRMASNMDDSFAAAEVIEDSLDAMEKFIADALLGWDNQTDVAGNPVEFNLDDLDLLVNETDLGELSNLIRTGGVSDEEVGKSDSPSHLETEPAAQTDAGQEPHSNPDTPPSS